MKVTAKVDTIIKHQPIASTKIASADERFALKAGSHLEVNWFKSAPNNHWEIELKAKHGKFFNWFAFKAHVNVDGVALQDSTGLSTQMRAFLDMISVPEGTSGPDGYRTMFTGKLFSNGFVDHPRQVQSSNGLRSDAAGRYQFLSTTWDMCQKKLNLTDFSPPSQDRAAAFLIKNRHAQGHVEAGRIREACNEVSYEWASLPPGRYGQPSISFKEVERLFVKFGGVLA